MDDACLGQAENMPVKLIVMYSLYYHNFLILYMSFPLIFLKVLFRDGI